MAFDGVFYSYLVKELNDTLAGHKVDQIHHPAKDELVFTMRSRQGTQKLFFSLVPQRARVNVTTQDIENPTQPSMFCMLLRKKLTGAALTGIAQEGMDRVLYFHFSGTDDIGQPAQHTIVTELFGRRPNFILLDGDGVILEALRRVDRVQSPERPIWPGLPYQIPALNPKAQANSWEYIESCSQFLDDYYTEADQARRARQKTAALRQLLETRMARLRRKLAAQRQELAQAEHREHLRIGAELILANKAQLENDPAARQSSAYLLENYYDGNRVIAVSADPALSPGANAQKLFKAYRKAKTAANLLGGLITQGEQELEYLESVEELLARANTQQEVDALRGELEQQGYCKRKNASQKKQKTTQLAPLLYITSEGLRVLVGRNNLQNDQLTLKSAKATDLWFHAHNYPGSHVILCTEGREAAQQSILEAATIAAWHSKAQGAATVDYTLVRNIKKPNGAPPGKVIFRTHQSVAVTAAEAEIEQMRRG